MSQSQGENKNLIKTVPEKTQILDLQDKDFIKFAQRTKKNHEDLKETRRIMYHQVDNINRQKF